MPRRSYVRPSLPSSVKATASELADWILDFIAGATPEEVARFQRPALLRIK
jgi:hypothetical protein